MARINVNPTRMELNKLKSRLKTATRGYKLLKDKTDEMIRRFSELIKKNKALREDVENNIANVFRSFTYARSVMSKPEIKLAFSMPSVSLSVECETQSIMSVVAPKLDITENLTSKKLPYSFANVTSEADYSVKLLGTMADKLIKLAELEKTTLMLAREIEKGKRRVNALENVLIPNIAETIKYISMKLEENDRSSRTRLMKVKSMIEQK